MVRAAKGRHSIKTARKTAAWSTDALKAILTPPLNLDSLPWSGVSVADDMSGLGSARPVRLSEAFWRVLDAREGSRRGCADGAVFEPSAPLGIGGAEPGRGGGAIGGERADVPALDAALRGGGRSRALGPQARQGVGQAGPGGSGGGSGAALSRALPGLHGQALPRASHQGPRLRLGLHLDEAASAMEGCRRKGAAQRRAPQEARATMDDATGIEHIGAYSPHSPSRDGRPFGHPLRGRSARSQRFRIVWSTSSSSPA
jgi:hypothetical protein